MPVPWLRRVTAKSSEEKKSQNEILYYVSRFSYQSMYYLQSPR